MEDITSRYLLVIVLLACCVSDVYAQDLKVIDKKKADEEIHALAEKKLESKCSNQAHILQHLRTAVFVYAEKYKAESVTIYVENWGRTIKGFQFVGDMSPKIIMNIIGDILQILDVKTNQTEIIKIFEESNRCEKG